MWPSPCNPLDFVCLSCHKLDQLEKKKHTEKTRKLLSLSHEKLPSASQSVSNNGQVNESHSLPEKKK